VGVAVDRKKIFVGGEFVEGTKGEWRGVLNPATGEVIAEVPECSEEDVDGVVQAASRAFEGWFDTTPAERSEMLHRLADLLEEHAEELVLTESRNVGKPIASARSEMPYIVDNLRFFAGAGRLLEGKSAGEYTRGYTSMIRREPVGVVGQIAPWNYPLMMAVWKIAPALAAGNTVVLKPSEQTLTTIMMAELAADIFPGGVLNIITGDGEPVGASIVRHPGVDMVSLTGDVATGKAVAAAAAETLKRMHLELGGKAPVVVFDDADLEAVVESIRYAGYANSGQDCTAASQPASPRVLR
jgi:acyl-CoA reductase-like NAD-dependent aldehyde dehydrogenase